jgi:hypothetical protein
MCATREDTKPLKKFTEKSKEKRKEERKDFPKFFQDAIEELRKNPVCQNCLQPINANYNAHFNIAHLLAKGTYKSVSTHPENYVFLCSWKDNTGNDCHKYFDDHILARPHMRVFKLAKEKYLKFKDEVLEDGREKYIFDEN